ncbi:tRNA(Arg) A34 adenosine deaminase TadA [Amycolatopsis arida]|uniref:tRNA(Arg) A34 adenosine deaminase TadA n=1 Tax=Amycolatopsis arida TaxID=587909 RepID=A0A1I5KFS3_9PSEU|nr:nucleoside deaminase [Amycolatopsis arida]TDX97022.1 tRNA(Arg) A34 adenosine deaminase TadA [Amycolatopsis arida]SFO83797.1 tRNA(Arg) A34 adenosine deaminase TadA [Amycolatopsis arida]
MDTILSTVEEEDRKWLGEAVRLATANVTAGGGPFGAVVVRDGAVIATGTNQVTPTLDPTAHAEVVAIRAACQAVGDFRLTGCVLVSSCEPCPLCLSAALWARVDRVCYAADRDDAAAAGFDDREFYTLFGTPRETWPMAVGQLSGVDHVAPFDAWRAKPDRLAY